VEEEKTVTWILRHTKMITEYTMFHDFGNYKNLKTLGIAHRLLSYTYTKMKTEEISLEGL
jgi:hypothetical protein